MKPSCKLALGIIVLCVGVLTQDVSYKKLIEIGKEKNIAGTSEVFLTSNNNGESTLGNFIADAMLAATEHIADIAIIPSSIIRGNISKGDVSQAMVQRILKEDITISVVKMTGQKLKQILENSVRELDTDEPEEFVQVSGIQLEYDLTQPKGMMLAEAWLKDKDGNKMNLLLEKENIYKVAVTNKSLGEFVKSQGNLKDSILDYLSAFPNKTIPSSKYKRLQCRIYLMSKSHVNRKTIIYFLLCVMAISGVLTIITNSALLFKRSSLRKEEQKAITSLACIDLFAGIFCTPCISLNYYYSKFLSIVKTPTQPQLNSTRRLDTNMTLHTTHTNSMFAISQLLLIRF